MNKTICEPIKLIVDMQQQVDDLIKALINNYDIYVKQVKDKNQLYCFEITRYEVSLYERNKDEQSNVNY